jgi:hypothetical protein
VVQTFFELEHKLLNQHHDHYVSFTRLVLSLAVGSFSLLAAFRQSLLSSERFEDLAWTAFPLLLVSILAGLLVQHRIMMNPIFHLRHAKALADASTDEVAIEVRRKPSGLEMWFYRIQVLAFLFAFIVLSVYLVASRAT